MKEWEKREIEVLFEKFFIALNYTPDEAEVILNKFETGSLREQNCFLEFMRRVVYGYDFDWHEQYSDFLTLWYHWVEYGYKETGKYPVIVPLNCTSSSVLSVPVINCPITKVPTIVSSPKVISVISIPPIKTLITDSTIAVASLIVISPGLFACVIVCPTNFVKSWVPVALTLITVFVSQSPSDTRIICSFSTRR